MYIFDNQLYEPFRDNKNVIHLEDEITYGISSSLVNDKCMGIKLTHLSPDVNTLKHCSIYF